MMTLCKKRNKFGIPLNLWVSYIKLPMHQQDGTLSKVSGPAFWNRRKHIHASLRPCVQPTHTRTHTSTHARVCLPEAYVVNGRAEIRTRVDCFQVHAMNNSFNPYSFSRILAVQHVQHLNSSNTTKSKKKGGGSQYTSQRKRRAGEGSCLPFVAS